MDPPIFVSLLDFVRTGAFGTAKASRRDPRPTIFLYGGWEFYVDCDTDILYSVRCDGEPLRGGDTLVIDPWKLRFGLSVADAESTLIAESIAFDVRESENDTRLVVGSGVVLMFAADPDDNDGIGLWAIECWRHDLLPHHEPTKQVTITLTESEYESLRHQAVTNRKSIGKQCAEWVREHLSPRAGRSRCYASANGVSLRVSGWWNAITMFFAGMPASTKRLAMASRVPSC